MACSSNIEVSRYVFCWSITYNKRAQKGSALTSDLFYSGIDQECIWRMKFYPTGNGYVENYASCELILIHGTDVTATAEISLLDKELVLAESTISQRVYNENHSECISSFASHEKLNYCYSITMRCQLHLQEKNKILPYVRRLKDMHQVIDDVHSSYFEQKATDISLFTPDQCEFKAHKLILSARSEVFAAMFQSDMKENLDGRIEISDMIGADVEEMLRYIYSGKICNWSHLLCMNLFVAGDKYKINGLKETCSQYLRENMTKEISIKVFILADMHGDKQLKTASLNCSKRNVKEIVGSPDWKILVKEHPLLLDELVIAVSYF